MMIATVRPQETAPRRASSLTCRATLRSEDGHIYRKTAMSSHLTAMAFTSLSVGNCAMKSVVTIAEYLSTQRGSRYVDSLLGAIAELYDVLVTQFCFRLSLQHRTRKVKT